MVDEATLTQAAVELMQNAGFMQSVENLKQHYIHALLNTAANEQDQREEIYRRVAVLGSVINELADIAQNPIETAH